MRILMIAYPFPPYGGMSQRTVYFANHLAERGHHVDVIAARPSRRFRGYDAGMLSLVSGRVNVHRTFAGALHHIRHSARSYIRNGLGGGLTRRAWAAAERVMAPASAVEWLPLGLARGARLCQQNDYDLVYCHGDPYIANVLSLILRKLFRVPWVMYVGDPRYFGASPRFRFVLERLERACLGSASGIVVNCRETRDGYWRHFPEIEKKKYSVITDGFDRARFNEIAGEATERFRIVYTGVFYDAAREPLELFRAIGSLAADGAGRDIELVVAGEEPGRYREIISGPGIGDRVRFLGHQPHDRAISLQKGAAVLLLLGWTGGFQVPGKLFEYYAARRPVLVIRNDHDDVASKMVDRHRRGLVVNNRAEEIGEALTQLHRLWKKNELEQCFDLDELNEYTWERLAGNLEQVLKATVAS